MIKIKENIVARQIHDSFFLIDIKQNYLNGKCSLYEINEIGYFIWNNLSLGRDKNEISRLIKIQTDDEISMYTIMNDVEFFLNILDKEGFIEGYGRD